MHRNDVRWHTTTVKNRNINQWATLLGSQLRNIAHHTHHFELQDKYVWYLIQTQNCVPNYYKLYMSKKIYKSCLSKGRASVRHVAGSSVRHHARCGVLWPLGTLPRLLPSHGRHDTPPICRGAMASLGSRSLSLPLSGLGVRNWRLCGNYRGWEYAAVTSHPNTKSAPQQPPKLPHRSLATHADWQKFLSPCHRSGVWCSAAAALLHPQATGGQWGCSGAHQRVRGGGGLRRAYHSDQRGITHAAWGWRDHAWLLMFRHPCGRLLYLWAVSVYHLQYIQVLS